MYKDIEFQPDLNGRLGKVASDLFWKVSGRYPNSVEAQAAAIALHCQENNLQPGLLRDSYLQSVELVEETTTRINNMKNHRYVTRGEVEGIIFEDFALARSLVRFGKETIKDILTKFDELRSMNTDASTINDTLTKQIIGIFFDKRLASLGIHFD